MNGLHLQLPLVATAGLATTEVTMKDEFTDRLLAIKLHLEGQSVDQICHTLHRSRDWFHRWWRRYRALGPDGLFEQTRAAPVSRRLAADLERTILMIRQRIESRVHPGTRYSLI